MEDTRADKPDIIAYYNKINEKVDIIDKLLSKNTSSAEFIVGELCFFYNIVDIAPLVAYYIMSTTDRRKNSYRTLYYSHT